MNDVNSMKKEKIGLLLAAVFLLGGCGLSQKVSKGSSSLVKAVFTREVDTLHLSLVSRSALNNDAGGVPLPTVVRVYQLKARPAFDTASYRMLQAQDTTVLSADLLSRQVLNVMPAASATVETPLTPETQYVAVIALFQSPDLAQDTWRVVLARDELEPDTPRVIDLRDNTLTLRKAK